MTVSNGERIDSSDQCDLATRFHVPGTAFSFHRQYSKIYAARFAAARPLLLRMAKKRWGAIPVGDSGSQNALSSAPINVRSLNGLQTNERCVIIGTVYKEMRLKPSILRELAAQESLHLHYNEDTMNSDHGRLSPGDKVFLEDDMQRISLVFPDNQKGCDITANRLPTGVVIAVLGLEPENDQGLFLVEDVAFITVCPEHPIVPRLPENSQLTLECTQFRTTGPWLALVSGLGFTGSGPTTAGHAMALQLLADWLRCSGDWTLRSDEDDGAVGVVRLMILGDSISPTHALTTGGNSCLTQQARYLTRNAEADSVTAMARFDTWLSNLPLGPGPQQTPSNGLPIDLLPGPNDVTSQLLPQQPIHAAAFPLGVSRAGGTGRGGLVGRTNPYLCQLYDRKVLATSGQGINDLSLYTDLQDPCARMEATLHWGHLAPTCPDTLPSYPLVSNDTLLFKTTGTNDNANHSPDYPDIYVAGCQPDSDTTWKRAKLQWEATSANGDKSLQTTSEEGALLIAVPRFSVSSTLVLVHLETLQCRTVQFDTSALDD